MHYPRTLEARMKFLTELSDRGRELFVNPIALRKANTPIGLTGL